MPKQSGIHQIRGKYGTTCYYFTKGKQNGLQRGINQQMSERVKRDPEFANTRLYAREFGYSGRLAALSFVPTEFGITLNLRNNSQGRLTMNYRRLLNEYGTGNFGKRFFVGTEWQNAFVREINAMGRVSVDIMYPLTMSVELLATDRPGRYDIVWTIRWTDELVQKMEQMGLHSLLLRLRQLGICAGVYNADAGAYLNVAREVGQFSADYQLPIEYARTHSSYQVTIHGANINHPTDEPGDNVTGMSRLYRPMVAYEGYRRVGGVDFKQQTICGFKVLDNATVVDPEIQSVVYNGTTYLPGGGGITIPPRSSLVLTINADYLRSFATTDDFVVTANGQPTTPTILSDNHLMVDLQPSTVQYTITTISMRYPDGTTATIRLA